MADERDRYFAPYNGTNLGFNSPKAIYDNIKDKLGVKDFTERQAGQDDGTGGVIFGLAGRYLPRLSLKLGGRRLGGAAGDVVDAATNSADDDGVKQIRVFCALDDLSTAIATLPGESTRGRVIISAHLPKKRVYI